MCLPKRKKSHTGCLQKPVQWSECLKSHFCWSETKGAPNTVFQAHLSFLSCLVLQKENSQTCINLKVPQEFQISQPTSDVYPFFKTKNSYSKKQSWKPWKPDRHFFFDLPDNSATSAPGTCRAMLEGSAMSSGSYWLHLHIPGAPPLWPFHAHITTDPLRSLT